MKDENIELDIVAGKIQKTIIIKVAQLHRTIINPLVEPKMEEKYRIPNLKLLTSLIIQGYTITLHEQDDIITIEAFKKLNKTK